MMNDQEKDLQNQELMKEAVDGTSANTLTLPGEALDGMAAEEPKAPKISFQDAIKKAIKDGVLSTQKQKKKLKMTKTPKKIKKEKNRARNKMARKSRARNHG